MHRASLSDMSSLSTRVLAASAGRDRVSDGVKALALALVILGHGLAWTITPGGPVALSAHLAAPDPPALLPGRGTANSVTRSTPDD